MGTINEAPVLLSVAEAHANTDHLNELKDLGAEVLAINADKSVLQLLLKELGRRQLTNVLVEAGGSLLGSFFDESLIDEVHVFVAPKIVGGQEAVAPVGGQGLAQVPQLPSLRNTTIRQFGDDVLIEGRINTSSLSAH